MKCNKCKTAERKKGNSIFLSKCSHKCLLSTLVEHLGLPEYRDPRTKDLRPYENPGPWEDPGP